MKFIFSMLLMFFLMFAPPETHAVIFGDGDEVTEQTVSEQFFYTGEAPILAKLQVFDEWTPPDKNDSNLSSLFMYVEDWVYLSQYQLSTDSNYSPNIFTSSGGLAYRCGIKTNKM